MKTVQYIITVLVLVALIPLTAQADDHLQLSPPEMVEMLEVEANDDDDDTAEAEALIVTLSPQDIERCSLIVWQ